jgi:phosphoribosyl 1,2-cyclic phosphate phosphodiesterase
MTLACTILGCGSSGGVPRVGSGWGACDSGEPRNRRRRCSILVERTGPSGTTRLLVDTSPDVREQLLDADVTDLDAVLFTHSHADHTHGIDDLRPLVIHNHRRMDVWADSATAADLRERFGYCFATPPGSGYPPILTEHRVIPGEPLRVDGAGGAVEALPFDVEHGDTTALGYRFGGIAYTPDLNAIPDAAMPVLSGLDVWIVDALRPKPHPSHFSLAEALAWIERLKPRRAVLTNLHSDLDYRALAASLPAHIVPAFDGMRLEQADD